ncbi:HTH domain-containing protein [Aquimarina sp. 2201CG1-2-11]|uniref:HTH domain-containing protein n=1 Tax=Aquimarina discodermiae TaxID=3231043 RepID=UPI003461B241
MSKSENNNEGNFRKQKIMENAMLKNIEMIERIDRLIRMQATGSPEYLASRLGISKTTLYRIIKTMKTLNAPVIYDYALQSFVYEKAVGFQFGFFANPTIVKSRALN